jgi:5-methylcytosine-specific restriction endonuclease McrA
MAGNPRNGRPYRRLCEWQRALGLPCWWCRQPIDSSPWAFTLDHALPLSRGGDLLDPANARSAHRRCNSARGNRTTTQPRPREQATRRW